METLSNFEKGIRFLGLSVPFILIFMNFKHKITTVKILKDRIELSPNQIYILPVCEVFLLN